MRRFWVVWQEASGVVMLGSELSVAYSLHGITNTFFSHVLRVDTLLPVLLSSGVLLGGFWLRHNLSTAAEKRRIGAWYLLGSGVGSVIGFLIARLQRPHNVPIVNHSFVLLIAILVGVLLGSVLGHYNAHRQHHQRARQTREQALNDLHTATRTFVQTTDQHAIATRAVETARDILDMPINTCWLYDGTEAILTPVAATDEAVDLVGELPTYTGDDSLSWEAFETGEVLVFDDISDAPNRHRLDTPIRSEIILPLGEYGVMNIGATEAEAFDAMDISLARILAANTRTALERADREHQLATARDRATELNRQLTVLNRVVRHDLRNAANVIHGHAEALVTDATSDSMLNSARAIRDRAAELVEMEAQVHEFEQILQVGTDEYEQFDIVDIITRQLDRIEQEYPMVETTRPTCETCYVTAHPRLEAAVSNVLENAIEHNDTDIPHIDVQLSKTGDGSVAVRIGDNGPGIPDSEVAVLERGYETPLEHASGLGLWLVNWIVRESDGDISFTENQPRGSVVSLQLNTAPPKENCNTD